jgi:trk system potassium uptake protein TrkA
MKVLIVGGGKIGYYLAKTLLSMKHKVSVIEMNIVHSKEIADEFGINVINGDGTNLDDLRNADAENADFMIAVTGKDEDNLISCQLAKKNFNVKKTIARVNNPKNIKVFERLGVDTAISSTSIIADIIEHEVDYKGVTTLMKLKDGKIVIYEVNLPVVSSKIGKSLNEIKIPANCIVTSIIRKDEAIIPHGMTILNPEDILIVVSSIDNRELIHDYFID